MEFLDKILHTYYTFLSTLDYKFLSNHLQCWRSYGVYIKRDHPVYTKMSIIGRNARWHFLTFFQNSWEFWYKLYTPIFIISNYDEVMPY